MKKILRGLLVSLMTISAAQAVTTDHTYMAGRSELSNGGIVWAVNNHHNNAASDEKLGATLMATGFYRQTHNKKDLGTYFGTKDNAIVVAKSPADTTTPTNVATQTAADLVKGLYSYNVESIPATTTIAKDGVSGSITLNPERTVYGAYIGWNQSLDTLLDGLSMSVTAPIVNVSTSTRALSTKAVKSSADEANGGPGATLMSFFDGTASKVIGTPAANSDTTQAALTHGKVTGKTVTKDQTGVADVDVRVNWNFMREKRYTAGVGLSVIVPTGNSSTGEFMFEPVYGNNGHVAFGGNLNGTFKVKDKGAVRCDVHAQVDYKYVFEATEKRIAGVQNKAGTILPGSAYRLTFQTDKAGALPAANVLVQDMKVTPGSQVEAIAGLAMTWKNFTFDVAYNLFWAEAETVKADAWTNDTYALAGQAFPTTATTIAADDVAETIGGPLQKVGATKSDLTGAVVSHTISTAAAANPKQTVHTLAAGVGYTCQGDYPIILGLGGTYDFADSSDNAQREDWSVFAKVGICF